PAYFRCLRTDRRKRASAHGSPAVALSASASATALRAQDHRRAERPPQPEEGGHPFRRAADSGQADRAMERHRPDELRLARGDGEGGGGEGLMHVAVAEHLERPRVPLQAALEAEEGPRG